MKNNRNLIFFFIALGFIVVAGIYVSSLNIENIDNTVTPTQSVTVTSTNTLTPTFTPTITPTATFTLTPSPTETNTPVPEPKKDKTGKNESGSGGSGNCDPILGCGGGGNE